MDHETQIDVSKKMYFGGYFFLPWLWMVNYLLFRPYMKRQDCPEEVKQYAKRSFVLFFCFHCVDCWLVHYVLLSSFAILGHCDFSCSKGLILHSTKFIVKNDINKLFTIFFCSFMLCVCNCECSWISLHLIVLILV